MRKREGVAVISKMATMMKMLDFKQKEKMLFLSEANLRRAGDLSELCSIILCATKKPKDLVLKC
jgi:hypothetical protein